MRRAALLAALCLACATRLPPIDPGVVRGATWESAALGLAATLPAGWAFLEPAAIEQGVRAEAEGLPGALRRSKGALAGSTTLFGMVDRAHAPAPGRARRALLAYAQRVPNATPGLTSETLASELERGLLALDMPIEIATRRHAIVAGRRFVVVPTLLTHEGVRGRLDHYLRYDAERLLVLTVSYPPEETAPPQEAIDALRPLAQPNSQESP